MMRGPLTTERLEIRAPVEADVEPFLDRRSHPDVARYQSWALPIDRAAVAADLRSAISAGGPQTDHWWSATIVARSTGAPIGDLAIRLEWEGRSAEIGFSLDPVSWGRGYAVEAVGELVRFLFEDLGVSRVHGSLHPDNLASAAVLERTGFLFEGHTRNSFWLGDVVSDDWLYGQTPDDHAAWVGRPRHAPETVELVPVDHTNQHQLQDVVTHHSQRRFVAPTVRSFAAALFPEPHEGVPVTPWLRAVAADGELVGFTMLALQAGENPYLWRLLIDRLHQRRGIGHRVLDLVVEHVRASGASALDVSWVTGPGSPEPLYLRYGFEPTGDIDDGEIVARLTL